MRNMTLDSLPPQLDGTDPYISEEIVDAIDPNIGMFNATAFVTGPLDLYVVNLDGTNSGQVHATLDPNGGHVHTPIVPEPTSVAIFGIGALGMVGMGIRRRRDGRAMTLNRLC